MPDTPKAPDTTDTAPVGVELAEPSRRSQDSREVKFVWDLGDDPEGGVRQVVLSIMHHKYQRGGAFTAQLLNQTEEKTRFGVEQRMGSITDWTQILSKQVARYSNAQLEQFATEALDRLRVLYGQDDGAGEHTRSRFTRPEQHRAAPQTPSQRSARRPSPPGVSVARTARQPRSTTRHT